jgi:hypothetical protein
LSGAEPADLVILEIRALIGIENFPLDTEGTLAVTVRKAVIAEIAELRLIGVAVIGVAVFVSTVFAAVGGSVTEIVVPIGIDFSGVVSIVTGRR